MKDDAKSRIMMEVGEENDGAQSTKYVLVNRVNNDRQEGDNLGPIFLIASL